MSIRLVIFSIFIIELGLCNSQHVRHERTRYMTGKDRIYSNYPQNNIPTNYNYWDRPYSSRPLFSWDDYRMNKITTPGSTRYYSHVAPTVSTVRYPKKYYPPQQRSTLAYQNSYVYNGYPYYNKTRAIYPQKVHQEHSGSKGVIYRNSRVYNYDPTRSPGVSKPRYGWSNYQKGYRRRKYCKIGSDGICRRIYTRPYGYYMSNEVIDRTTRAPRRYRHSEEDLYNEKDDSKSLNEVTFNEDEEMMKDKLCSEKKCEQICKYDEGEAVCACLEGYALSANGTNCTDVNECEIDNGNCGDGTCMNTIGSRKCICNEGFRFSDDKCVDVNECLLRNGHGPCQDKCTNTRGSYVCSCENLLGTRLGDDRVTCEDANECDAATMGCSHSCVSILGRNFCTCPEGFELGDDWKTCKDIDECLNLEEMNIRCKYDCVNTIGSFHCDVGNEISQTIE